MITDENFVFVYQRCEDIRATSRILGIKEVTIINRARNLRKMGIPLKDLRRPPGRSQTNLERLKIMAENAMLEMKG